MALQEPQLNLSPALPSELSNEIVPRQTCQGSCLAHDTEYTLLVLVAVARSGACSLDSQTSAGIVDVGYSQLCVASPNKL